MNKYVITYGFHDQDENHYRIGKTKSINAKDEDEASIKFKDQFESLEGIPVDIIKVELVTN
jgi:hypothetical protein